VTGLGGEGDAEVGPPDLAAPRYHFSRRKTSRDAASVAGSSFDDAFP
jgi:hypothetical protein